MNRRRPGFNGQIATTRKENDEFVITSGVTNKITNGKDIKMHILNTNIRPGDYQPIFRPGHAD
jgi:chorismate synthase